VTFVTRAIRRARRAAGYETRDVISQIAARDERWTTYCRAVEYINYEAVAGDIVEFGVFTGMTLALLAKAQTFDPKGNTRRVAGFDSFEGLPPSHETHARWQRGDCSSNHSWHPLLPVGAAVTPGVTRDLFAVCGLDEPLLHIQVALAHFDCDLYESTRDALAAMAPVLQDGAILLFDDWFHYRGHPGKGEARAFTEFLGAHPEWGAVQYQPYATFCNSFILHRR
jgi:hypothetical protein